MSRDETLVGAGYHSITSTVALAASIKYFLGRSYQTSAKLYTQHWLWKLHLGYTLYRDIPLPDYDTAMVDASQYTIVDIGTGNACWLVELNRQLEEQLLDGRVDLYGYDISSRMFPNKEDLPMNLELGLMDEFFGLPEGVKINREGLGFNVVHLRTVSAIVQSVERLERLVSNVVGMLKPRGYIQWEEMDVNTLRAQAPNEMTTTDSTSKILAIWKEAWKKIGVDFGWIPKLQTYFPHDSIEIQHISSLHMSKDLRRACTDNVAMELDEMAVEILQRSTTGGRAEFGISGEEYAELWNRAAEEMLAGVSILVGLRVLVGQKRPLRWGE